MKKYKKGLVVPALLIIISLLVVGGTIYIYNNEKVAITPEKTSPTALTEKPTITVISPNGGETFNQGSPIIVKWSQNFSSSVSVCLMGDAGCVYNSTPVAFNAGVNSWTIPANINIATCTVTTCYVADGFKVKVTTDNQPGSGHVGEFMNDEGNGYFVILPQTGLQAQSFLQKMQSQIGTNYKIKLTEDSTVPTYRVDLPTDKFDLANDYLLSQFGKQNTKYISELGSGYENWHIICRSIGRRASSTRSDLPYVTCNDKIGIQKIDVVVKDIKAIDTDSRTFNLTIGNETMKVKMPSVVQNTSNGNGTFADFVRTIDSVQYQSSMFKMTGEIKGDIFEVSTIEWILG